MYVCIYIYIYASQYCLLPEDKVKVKRQSKFPPSVFETFTSVLDIQQIVFAVVYLWEKLLKTVVYAKAELNMSE